MPVYMKEQYNPLGAAIQAGTQAFNQFGQYRGMEAERNLREQQAATSLAQASKFEAETGVIGDQRTAMQALPGQFTSAYRLQHGLVPEEDRGSLYGEAMGGMAQAGGSDVENYMKAMNEFSRGGMLTEGQQILEDDPVMASQLLSAGNKLAMPDMSKITGDYMFNPMDPEAPVTTLAGAARSNKPVPVTIDGVPTMAVWTGQGYEPVTGAAPPATGSTDPRGKLKAGQQWIQRPGGEWGSQPIPGSDQKTPEQSAKIAMLSQGMRDLDKAKTIIYDEQGNVNTGVLAMMQGANLAGMSGVPGTQSRELYSLIYNAIEGKLRAESGAAVPDSEVVRMAKRFVPSAFDNDDTVRSKLERLEDFMVESLSLNYPAGVPASLMAPSDSLAGAVAQEVSPQPSGGAVDISGMSQAEIDSLPPGTRITQGGRSGVTE